MFFNYPVTHICDLHVCSRMKNMVFGLCRHLTVYLSVFDGIAVQKDN